MNPDVFDRGFGLWYEIGIANHNDHDNDHDNVNKYGSTILYVLAAFIFLWLIDFMIFSWYVLNEIQKNE